MKNKILSFLGLAQRSGNIVTGEDTCELNIKKNKVVLVLIPQNASENTKKKFENMCNFKNINFIIWGDRDELSQSVGKENRTVYGIKNKIFADKILEFIRDMETGLNNLRGE